ncbi:unnamed protein product [Clonostachys byssicola]|uniref:F-box domain-containing protein n=1 Tax=Clonostachys byssicola TaxID=160290 RepID=A0A9N9UV74_9HYPO|nr:unnamed protein product [Clonostachys byssicola]
MDEGSYRDLDRGYEDLHCCPICGVRVGPEGERPEDRPALWAHKYRACAYYQLQLSMYMDEFARLRLTEECKFIGPEPAHFYHIHPVSDTAFRVNEHLEALGVANQPAYNNRRGFVFHAHCWCILSMANGPSPIPLRRLFDVCSSLHIVGNTLHWGHDYQGLPGFSVSDNSGDAPAHGLDVSRQRDYIVACDPIHDYPAVLFGRYPDVPPAWPARAISNCRRNSDAQDPFSRLPMELILIIAAHVETTDVLKMRLATREFWPLLHDEAFWKTRFGPGSERAWLFSVYHDSEHSWLFNSFSEPEHQRWLEYGAWQPEDWRSLWRQTRPERLGPDLNNLQRVWELAEAILLILRMRPGPTENHSPLPEKADVGYWLRYHGEIQELVARAIQTGDAYRFTRGCRELYCIHSEVSKSMCRLTFYFVDMAGSRYLAGLKMTDRSGAERLMGYESSTAVEFCPYNLGRTFRGFTAGSNLRGIVGVRVHWSTHVSEWIGEAVEGGRARKIWVSRRVRYMEVGFDGFKIVKMRVHYPGTTVIDSEKEAEKYARWKARFVD